MDHLKDWWVNWRVDWPFIEYEGKANGFAQDYECTLPAFFMDLEATSPELRKKYYSEQVYDLLLTMVIHRDLPSIRRLFELCPGWNGRGYIEGLTPLGQALDNRDLACMRFLLEKGADTELYDQTLTVLEAAIYDGMGMDVYCMLLDFGATFTSKALLALASEGNADAIRHLLDNAHSLQHDSRPGLLEASLAEADSYVSPEERLPAVLTLIQALQKE